MVLKKGSTLSRTGLSSGLMVTPATILLLVCSIYPFFWMVKYCCYDYDGFRANFTGWRNFTRVLNDAAFWSSVLHTFEYAFYKIICIIPLSLLVAVLLNNNMAGTRFFRAVYFMPTVISTAIYGMIFSFIFATGNGIINSFLKALHLIKKPIGWLTTTDWVMVAVIVMAVWGGFGNYMLYFTTGISGISSEVYEAAKIDGANTRQMFFRITLPMLAPTMKIVLMLALVSAFWDYEAIMVLSNGGPGNRSNVMFLYIYNMIFGTSGGSATMQIGYGAALSLVASVIIGILTGLYLLASRKLDDVM